MKRFILFVSLVFVGFFSLVCAQSVCDGNRYINEVFTETQSSLSVQFGQANTIGGNPYTLIMDIYEPVGDTVASRPLVILAHGGSFIFGNRSEFTTMCKDLAKRGYVAATIEYRLMDAFVFDSIQIAEEVVMAINDMRAAVRFFKEDAATNNVYQVDTNMVFVGGTSAGGITASHLAMMDTTDDVPQYVLDHMEAHGGFEGNSSANTQHSSNVQGLLNYSGALLRDHWIDAEDPPFYSAHDENDPVVPCGYGTTNAVAFPVFLYGSCEMKEVADTIGVKNQLHLIPGSSGHVSFMLTDYDTILHESVIFLEEIICESTATAIDDDMLADVLDVFPNPISGSFRVRVTAEITQYDLAMYSLTGQQVFGQSDLRQSELPVADLAVKAGAYVVVLTDQRSGRRFHEKVMVR
ncbi:MAG: alpha/beta hydrolase fold domain-containing protein [Bacteroidota bacterium]